MEREQKQQQGCCSQPSLGDAFAFYINGNVTETEREAIENHLATCPECREELRFYLAVQKIQKERRSLH